MTVDMQYQTAANIQALKYEFYRTEWFTLSLNAMVLAYLQFKIMKLKVIAQA